MSETETEFNQVNRPAIAGHTPKLRRVLVIIVPLLGAAAFVYVLLAGNGFQLWGSPESESFASSHVNVLVAYPQTLCAGQQLHVAVHPKYDFTGKLLVIDRKGKVFHEFKSGNFTVQASSYTYTPGGSIPNGQYTIVLADKHNNAMEWTDLTIDR